MKRCDFTVDLSFKTKKRSSSAEDERSWYSPLPEPKMRISSLRQPGRPDRQNPWFCVTRLLWFCPFGVVCCLIKSGNRLNFSLNQGDWIFFEVLFENYSVPDIETMKNKISPLPVVLNYTELNSYVDSNSEYNIFEDYNGGFGGWIHTFSPYYPRTDLKPIPLS